MADQGITQQELGGRLFMSQQALSRRLLGHVEFRSSELMALADVLGVSLADLTGASRVA